MCGVVWAQNVVVNEEIAGDVLELIGWEWTSLSSFTDKDDGYPASETEVNITSRNPLRATLKLDNHYPADAPEGKAQWPYLGLGVFLEAGTFTNLTTVRISYTASAALRIGIDLHCKTSNTNATYSAILPAGNHTARIFTLTDFLKPDWHLGHTGPANLGLADPANLIAGIVFFHETYGTSVNIEVTSIFVEGLRIIPTHKITATAGTGGTILPSGNIGILEGGSQTFTFTPEANKAIRDVLVNGVSVGAVSSYTFENIADNATIEVIFANKVIVEWGEQISFVYDGTEKKPTATATIFDLPIPLTISGGEIAAGRYTATASPATPNDNFVLTNTTIEFTIDKRSINVIWGNNVLAWHGEAQAPTATSSENEDYPLVVIGQRVNIGGNYTATARLRTFNPNIDLTDTTKTFEIVRRRVDVTWNNQTPYTYNRSPQSPTPSAYFYRGNEKIELNLTLEGNAPAAAGDYRVAARIRVITNEDADFYENITLTNNSEPFVILRAPLTARLRDNRTRIDKEPGVLSEGKLLEILTSSLEFSGFVANNDGKDDERNLELVIQIEDISHSLRSLQTFGEGEHIVSISNNADNYNIILERKIIVTISERFLVLENYPRATTISSIQKSDNRYGIRFAENPVSDKAEMSVILPNNEIAVETKIAIYDMTGNVVFSTTTRDNASWDLRNSAGRFVANGTYLVIVEVKSTSGKIYAYSARLGVKR